MGRGKKILTVLLIALPFACQEAQALNFTEQDKQLHLGASFLISSVTYATFAQAGFSHPGATVTSILLTLAVGAAKESRDVRWDSKDMQANLLGAAIAPILWGSF